MVSLKKNQTISLKKESSALNQLHFGLGWDPVRRNNQAKKGAIKIQRLNRYFSDQQDLSQAYGWEFRWQAGRK